MILVTGGTGLVGAHLLLDLCKKGFEPRAIYRNKSRIKMTQDLFFEMGCEDVFSQIDWKKADLLDITELTEAFEGVKKVYHAAAMISMSRRDDELMRKVNIEGTANMVNLALYFGVEKFCHVSSIAAIEKNPFGGLSVESEDWNPQNHKDGYSITKYGAEMEVWRGSQEGLSVAVVNPGVIVGPGFDKQGSGKLIRRAIKGIPFYTQGSVGFVGVNDVVEIMQTLMNSTIENERFILVSENLSYRNFFTQIAKISGAAIPSKKAGRPLLELAWALSSLSRFLGLKKGGMTRQTLKSSLTRTSFDNSKIKLFLPDFEFEPMQKVILETVNYSLTSSSSESSKV